jgi:hypothetical protein
LSPIPRVFSSEGIRESKKFRQGKAAQMKQNNIKMKIRYRKSIALIF